MGWMDTRRRLKKKIKVQYVPLVINLLALKKILQYYTT